MFHISKLPLPSDRGTTVNCVIIHVEGDNTPEFLEQIVYLILAVTEITDKNRNPEPDDYRTFVVLPHDFDVSKFKTYEELEAAVFLKSKFEQMKDES